MTEANETIFRKLEDFVKGESLAIIEKVLGDNKYDSLSSKSWANAICEQIIAKLSSTNHHFKYIVNCILLAAGGNGMDVTGLCYWDEEMDGSVTVKWDGNKTMTCIVNVYACAV